MKTTIDLPDELFQKAKILAVQRGMTFKDIVIQGLQIVTEEPSKSQEKERKADLKRLLQEMRACNREPMIPLKREEIYER